MFFSSVRNKNVFVEDMLNPKHSLDVWEGSEYTSEKFLFLFQKCEYTDHIKFGFPACFTLHWLKIYDQCSTDVETK